jgi:hypothetical protein
VANKVVLQNTFSLVILFSPETIIPPMIYTHLSNSPTPISGVIITTTTITNTTTTTTTIIIIIIIGKSCLFMCLISQVK